MSVRIDGNLLLELLEETPALENPEKIVALMKNPKDVVEDGYRCLFLMEVDLSQDLILFDWEWLKRERMKENAINLHSLT